MNLCVISSYESIFTFIEWVLQLAHDFNGICSTSGSACFNITMVSPNINRLLSRNYFDKIHFKGIVSLPLGILAMKVKEG